MCAWATTPAGLTLIGCALYVMLINKMDIFAIGWIRPQHPPEDLEITNMNREYANVYGEPELKCIHKNAYFV